MTGFILLLRKKIPWLPLNFHNFSDLSNKKAPFYPDFYNVPIFFPGTKHIKLKTFTLLQSCFSRIIAITSTQQNFTSVKKEQFDILTRLVQKPC